MKSRDAEFDDILKLKEIEKRIFSYPWREEHFYHEIFMNPIAHVIVFEENHDIVGYCDIWFSGESLEIANIGVDLRFQGKGYGLEILKYIEKKGRKEHVSNLSLEVRVSNHKAIKLYQTFGFKIITIKKGYYSENFEDAYYMIKELDYE